MRLSACILAGALLLTPAARAAEPELYDTPVDRHVAFGPIELGDSTLSLDIGWLKSALRAQIGVGFNIDLDFVASAFLLHNGLAGQKELYVGVRFSPVSEGLFRISIEPGVGQVFIGSGVGSLNNVLLRGEVTVGMKLDAFGAPYLRGLIRALRYDTTQFEGWGNDQEVGLGYELTLGRFVVGVEAGLWSRPGHPSLPSWRSRVGIGF